MAQITCPHCLRTISLKVDKPKDRPTGLIDKNTAYFNWFWSAYPRRVGKGAARAAWNRIKPDAVLVDKFNEALEKQKQSPQWQQNGGQFIPHPATWLNQRRWEDDPRIYHNEQERLVKILENKQD